MIMSTQEKKGMSREEVQARLLADMLTTGSISTNYEFNIKGHSRRFFEAYKDGVVCDTLNGLSVNTTAWRFGEMLTRTFELMDLVGAEKLTITCKLE